MRDVIATWTPPGISADEYASRSADALSSPAWWDVVTWAAMSIFRTSPVTRRATGSNGRASIHRPSAETSKPESPPGIGTYTAPDADRKSGAAGADGAATLPI